MEHSCVCSRSPAQGQRELNLIPLSFPHSDMGTYATTRPSSTGVSNYWPTGHILGLKAVSYDTTNNCTVLCISFCKIIKKKACFKQEVIAIIGMFILSFSFWPVSWHKLTMMEKPWYLVVVSAQIRITVAKTYCRILSIHFHTQNVK